MNLLNTLRGALLMFFILLAARVYPRRRENNALTGLFWLLVVMAAVCAKYMVFLVDGMYDNEYIVNLAFTIDMLVVPMVSAFLINIVRPGIMTKKALLQIFAPFIFFILFFAITGKTVLFLAMYIFTALFAAVAAYLAIRWSLRYDRYLKENYSEIQNKSVAWVRSVMFLFLAWYVVWSAILSIGEPWVKSLYYLFLIGVCTLIYRRTIRHTIIVPQNSDDWAAETLEDDGDISGDVSDPVRDRLNVNLEEYMQTGKLWLNPGITLTELAETLKTNRTYLSDYLNNHLGVSFYDYLNGFRIKHACHILVSEPDKTLYVVAEESGFNSLSTFRRTFEKQIGATPAQYRKIHKE